MTALPSRTSLENRFAHVITRAAFRDQAPRSPWRIALAVDTSARRSASRDFVRTRLSAHEYPREVAFIRELPMTTTGKIIRRKLRDLG